MSKPQIVIVGRRWFQKSYGNTYHTVTIYMPDGTKIESGQHYGYGEQYTQTATTLIYKHLGEPEPVKSPFWALRERFDVDYRAIDVPRMRDL